MQAQRDWNILLVDDDPDFVEMARWYFRNNRNLRVHLNTASAIEEALGFLEREKVDAVLADYQLPTGSGTELLKQVRTEHPDLHRVLLTGFDPGYLERAGLGSKDAELTISKDDFATQIERKLREILQTGPSKPS